MARRSLAGGLAVAMLWLGVALPVPSYAGETARSIAARVVDSVTGEPITGVAVESDAATTVTDAAGRFTLRVAADSAQVTVHRIGYHPLRLSAASLPAEIRLDREPVVLTSISVSAVAKPDRGLATGTHLALSTTPREAIASSASPSLAEAMEGTEAVTTSRPGAWGTKAFVRGLGGERVVVLLDGNRLNRACNVGMDAGLATINPDDVERVEVLSGPGSTLYGSGNVGGVINVVTRGPRAGVPFSGEIRTAASTAVPGGRAGASFWGSRERAAFHASIDGASYGDERTPRGTVPRSSFRDATVDASAVYGLGLPHRVEARVQRYAGRDIGYPGSGDAAIPREDRLLAALDYGWQASRGLLDGVNAKLYLQSVDHHMTMGMTRPPAMPGGMPMRMETDARSNTDTWGARGQVRLVPGRGASIDAGLEGTQWNADGTRWIERTMMGGTSLLTLRTWPGVRVADLGAFAQGLAGLAPWLDLSAGARIDDVIRRADGFESRTEWVPSGNAGLKATLDGAWYVRAAAGVGYRVPDPTELYGLLLRPDGFIYQGEPNLSTETSRSVEISIGRASARSRASVTVFRNQLHDYIATVVTGDSISGAPVRQYRNVADARIDGVTASLWAAASSRIDVNATVGATRGENRATGAPLPAIPPFESSLSVRVTPGASWPWIEPTWTAAARQTRFARSAGEVATPGFSVFDLRAGRSFGRLSVTMGVENVFDTAYRCHLDPQRVLRPGRNGIVKVTQGF
ncbi:MAG: TonB-dependent receptor [Hyphomicrobiales bacterium]